jgi:xanthine dehydrogenase accessory factor
VVVIDDRQEFANLIRFPGADEVIVCPFSEAFGQISVTGSSYIAIITRGHIHGRDVLRAVLQTGAAYIGIIASRRKREASARNS